MTPVLILGTGGFAQEIADVVSDCQGYEVVGLVENGDRRRCEESIAGLPVHWIDDIRPLAADHLAVCALGSTQRNQLTARAEDFGFRFATIIHPAAHVSSRSSLGEGTIVSPGVIVGAYSTIGRHVILNRGTLVGHHTRIGDHVSVMAGANVAGSCAVGERTFIGMGAHVLNNLSIGRLSVVGAGALVTRNVPDEVEVMGAPARVMRKGSAGR